MEWDTSSFGNDSAQDWLHELSVSKTGDPIKAAIETVDSSDNFVDAGDAERAIAACELVSASRGFPSAKLPPEAELWMKSQRFTATDQLAAKAVVVVGRILTKSELRDLWDGTEASESWLATVRDLQSRLSKCEAEVRPAAAALGGKETPAAPEAGQTLDEVFNEAVDLVAEGCHDAALAKYDRAIELEPGFAVAYIGRGTSCLALGKFEEALVDLNKAIDLEPEIAEAYYLRAQAYFQTGKTGRAIADLTILTNMAPDRSDAFFMRGLCNVEMGRHEKGIDDFSKAIEIDPDSAINAYLHRSEAYERTGRFDLAGKDMKQYERLTGSTRKL